jgi:hypothetical protein
MRVMDAVLVVWVGQNQAFGRFPVGLTLGHDPNGVLLDVLDGNSGHPLQDVICVTWPKKDQAVRYLGMGGEDKLHGRAVGLTGGCQPFPRQVTTGHESGEQVPRWAHGVIVIANLPP